MISRTTITLGFALTLALALLGAALSARSQKNARVRNFEFTYLTRIPASPAGAKSLRIWIPLPQSDPYQTISGLKIKSPVPYANHRDPEYGNEYLYLQVPAASVNSLTELRMSFQVKRHEHRVALDTQLATAQLRGLKPPDLHRFLQPDRLVPLQGVIEELSAQETRGIQDPLGEARAIYNYVVAAMRYDHSRPGWATGEPIRAFASKRSDWPDFHPSLSGRGS